MTDPQQTYPSGLYAFAECELVDLQNGGVLLIERDGPGQMLAAPAVAQAMGLCREFRTIEEHVEVLTSSIPQLAGQHDDVRNVLQMVNDAGLLVSADSVCERLNAAVPPPLDLPPTRVFIITSDRPEALQRLLDSMLHAGNLTHHEALFVIDDSRDPGNAARNREAVDKFNLTCPRNLNYLGADEAAEILAEIVVRQPQSEEAVRFLIDRERWAGEKSYGLARNLSLLLSVGSRAIVMDDDVICAAVEAPLQESGVGFGQREREVDFFVDQQDLLSRTSRADFDPLTGHARCLGLTVGQALQKLAPEPLTANDFKGANAAQLGLWDAGSPVIITQSGTVGDPGTPDTLWINSLGGSSARRLMGFPGGMENALSSRCYWLGQPRPLFTKLAVMSQITGLDNTRLLPPYFPVFRGEDYLFGAMTEYLHPYAAVLEYPWNVPHFPLDTRVGDPTPAPLSGRGKVNINEYVTDRTMYDPGITADARLTALAGLFRELSETSDAGLTCLFRREIARSQAASLAKLNNRLNDGIIRAPSWQQWLQASAAQLNQAMQRPAVFADHIEGVGDRGEADLLQTGRQLLGGFCAALENWEAIRSASAAVTGHYFSSGRFLT